MATSFLNFARRLKSTDESFVEFRAVLSSQKLFPNPNSWGNLRGALKRFGASDAAITGARLAWRDYRKALEKLAN